MPRYRPFGSRDDASLEERDEVFVGFRSRVQEGALPPGIARYAENMRFDRGSARPRKGTKAVATQLVLSHPPVVFSFVFGFDKAVTSITRAGATATVTTTAPHGYASTNQVQIRGAVQPEYNGEKIITVTGASTFTYAVTGTPATPATGTIIAHKGPVLYNLYTDLVRGSCEWVSRQRVEGIVMAVTDRAHLYREGQALTTLAFPAGETVEMTDKCALKQFLDKVYLFRGYQTAPVFALTSLTQAAGLATATSTAPHGRATGEWTTIDGATPSGYNGIFQITVTGASTFTFAVGSGLSSPATGTITARPCKPAMVWDGDDTHAFTIVTTGPHPTAGTLIRMPAVDWGEVAPSVRRFMLPYAQTQLVLGDLGDADTYDLQYKQLRIGEGTADWLVGASSYQKTKSLVLYRKSAHLVTLDATTLAPFDIETVTTDFGCVARRTVASCGDVVLWLSDQGVHGARIGLDLNLTPLAVPLSVEINDQIQTINWAYADKAVARYWNNRYYIAVPTGGATTNNKLFVFNFLNRLADEPNSLGEWESVDTFRGDFDLLDLHVVSLEGRRSLHGMASYGWLFALEYGEVDEWGTPATPLMTYPILGDVFSRDFRLGASDRKKFTRARVGSKLTTGDSFTVVFRARNPDSVTTLKTYTADATTDVDDPLRVPRIKGEAGSIEISTTAGRPEIRRLGVEATLVDRTNTLRK